MFEDVYRNNVKNDLLHDFCFDILSCFIMQLFGMQ